MCRIFIISQKIQFVNTNYERFAVIAKRSKNKKASLFVGYKVMLSVYLFKVRIHQPDRHRKTDGKGVLYNVFLGAMRAAAAEKTDANCRNPH